MEKSKCLAVIPAAVLVYLGQNTELLEILGLNVEFFEVVGGKEGLLNLSKLTTMFRGRYALTKVEVQQSNISELDMVKSHMRKLEEMHDIKAGLCWYAREEGDRSIVYHLLENGCGLEMLERLRKALELYPTEGL